jgi:threonine/homoserine/homoserine lactone efflux protein
MSFCTHFLLAFALSFIGSLPFGMINMATAYTAIQKGMRHALALAAGASSVELVQVFIALKFSWLFSENPLIERAFQIIAAALFFAAAIFFIFFAKTKPTVNEPNVYYSRRGYFVKGALISSLNLMVIPYWIFYGALLTANNLLVKDNAHVAVFSVGTMFGTFSLLCLYALLGDKILRKSEKFTDWANKSIGLLLACFGIYQIFQLLAGGK